MTARRTAVAVFGLLGAVSGALTTTLLTALPASWQIEAGGFIEISPMSTAAGLAFGVIIGAALRIRGSAPAATAALFAAASAVSYFAAVNLALNLTDTLEQIWLIGMIAGLAGSACLTALAALRLRFLRRAGPCALMLIAGCLLGALLEFPIRDGSGFRDWLMFYVPWQAGYAAAFATALPEARAGSG